jgi:hypothetical protein
MESPRERPAHISRNNEKILDQLTTAEKQQFINTAIAERDKFLAWAGKQKDQAVPKNLPVIESLNHAPSKKLFLATYSAIGLANIGLTLAASKIGLSSQSVIDLWGATFGMPILEELIFRSKKIPNAVQFLGKNLGVSIRPDIARLITSGVDNATHILWGGRSGLGFLFNAADGPFFQKIANEKGLSASVVAHALLNANSGMYEYFRQRQYKTDNIDLFGYTRREKDKTFQKISGTTSDIMSVFAGLTALTGIGSMLAIGITGIKEVIEDHQIQNMLSDVRNNNPINGEKLEKMTKKLLAVPSTDGYKFKAGVELAYVNAGFTMPDMLKDVMTPDEYARTQVHKMVTEVWKDPKTLPHRLEKANTYVSEQIAARESNSISRNL